MKTDNELIAEFMGASFMGVSLNEAGYYSQLPIPPNKIIISETCSKYVFELEYDKSWDWLMPVVEKIETLSFQTRILDNGMCIEGDFNVERWGESKIQGTYYTVVSFIKWYNEQKKS